MDKIETCILRETDLPPSPTKSGFAEPIPNQRRLEPAAAQNFMALREPGALPLEVKALLVRPGRLAESSHV